MRKGLLVGIIVLGLTSCLKQVEYPNRPDIEFQGVFLNPAATSDVDSLGFVKFSFTDGDGDLGLNDQDSTGQFALGEDYYYNLFIRYFEKQNGNYVEVIPPQPFHVRFERLSAVGGNGALEGEMDVRFYTDPTSLFDTVKYEMYIVDRSLQHSDTIVTPDLVFDF